MKESKENVVRLQFAPTVVIDNSVNISIEKYQWMLGAALGIYPSEKGINPAQVLRNKLYELSNRNMKNNVSNEEYMADTLPKLSSLLEYMELQQLHKTKAIGTHSSNEYVYPAENEL